MKKHTICGCIETWTRTADVCVRWRLECMSLVAGRWHEVTAYAFSGDAVDGAVIGTGGSASVSHTEIICDGESVQYIGHRGRIDMIRIEGAAIRSSWIVTTALVSN